MVRRVESRSAFVSLSGAFVWAWIAMLAGIHRAPFGIIELLQLFAVLVVVPLGLELARHVNSDGDAGWMNAARKLEPWVAAAVLYAFWLPPGRVAGACILPWVVCALMLALPTIAALFRGANRSVVHVIVSVAYIDLMIGSGWLLLSRAGVRPMGFLEPLVLLTAVLFHFSGFATALIAACTVRLFERNGVDTTHLRRVVWLVVLLPFVLGLGIAFSPVLRLLAALGLSASVTTLAALLFWFSGNLKSATARIFARAASGAALLSLSLACAYAVADYTGKPFLTMPAMASIHGVLNALGLVLLGTLACLIELQETCESEGTDSGTLRKSRWEAPELRAKLPRKQPAGVSQHLPEFVARDFYDR